MRALSGRKLLLASLVAVVSTGCWPQFRHDPAHTGNNSSESKLSASNVATVKASWAAAMESGGSADSSPAVVNGRVYVGSNDKKIYAFDAGTGATVWTAITGGAVRSSPAVTSSTVYVGSDDAKLYALDAATGATRWTVTTGGDVSSSPTVLDGVVYFGSTDHKLRARDAETGGVRWTATTGNTIASSPAVSGGIVYVGSSDNALWAFKVDTGAFSWKKVTGGAVTSSPAVNNGMVYVGSGDGKLYALDAASGALVWSADTGPIDLSSPAVADGTVYVINSAGTLSAWNAATGAHRWTVANGGAGSSPAVANGVVYANATVPLSGFGTAPLLRALRASDGATLWQSSSETAGVLFVDSPSSPAVTDGRVYVGARRVVNIFPSVSYVGELRAFRLPVHLDSVSPVIRPFAASYQLTLTGSNFEPGANADVGPGFVATTTYVSPTQLRVTLVHPGLWTEYGPTDVVVVNPQGDSSTCRGCLTITG